MMPIDLIHLVETAQLIEDGSCYRVSCGDVNVDLRGVDSDIADSLEEHLSPVWSVSRVDCGSHESAHKVIHCRTSEVGGTIQNYISNNGFKIAVYRCPEYTTYAMRLEWQGYYFIEEIYTETLIVGNVSKKHIHVLSCRKNNELYIKRFVKEISRLVRILIREQLSFDDTFFMHASSFGISDYATVFCGPKNGGKTTALLEGIAHCNGRYISNEVVGIKIDKGRFSLVPVPVDIRIKLWMLKRFEQLPRMIDSSLIGKFAQTDQHQDAKFQITPKSFMAKIGGDVGGSEKLGRIVILDPCPDRNIKAVGTVLDKSEARTLLLDNIIEESSRLDHTWLKSKGQSRESSISALNKFADVLVENVECIKASGGYGFHRLAIS